MRIQLNGYQIIKAIQIRLENYKKDILNKSTIGQKIDLLTSIQDNNFNINFLFSSQKMYYLLFKFSLNIDKYQTNVNNIMNSGFEIKKLFIEFHIPLSKFSRETQVGNQDCFKEKNEYIIDKNTIREICYDKSRNLKKPVISTNFKLNYGNDSNASTFLNKFDIIKKNKTSDEKKKSSREIKYNKNYFGGVNNQINYFEGVNENIRNSNIYNNTFVPNTQPFTHFTAQSPLYSQPYVYNNVNNNHYDQYYNNGYGNYYINNNYMSNRNPHLNYMMRYNNNTNVNKMKIYHQPNVMLNLNTNIYNNVKNSKNLCNWHVFMTNSTPLIYDTDELSLREFFNFYDKPSVIGLGCILKSKCRKILCSYLPTLSSLYVELINSSNDQVNSSFSSMSSKKTDTNLNAENQSNKIVSGFRNQANNFNLPLNTSNLETLTYHSNSTVESLFLEEENFLFEKKKKSDNMTSVINFTEDQILFNRQVLTSRLDELYKKYPELDTATLGDISENSYFSLLWTPIKSLNLLPINTSFLVYYKFRNKQFSYSIKFLNVLGVTSNKCDEDFWFTNQILIETSIMNEVIMNLLAEDFLRNKHQFYQYKESLQKLVMMKKVNSIDYNFLIK